jgi:GNAT superfamily N-acetyltransferase
MRISYLADHPRLIPELARLHFTQWAHLRPAETLEQRTRRLEACCGRGGVPSVVVALEDAALVGSAMLVANDMDTRPDLTPWLAGVYVAEDARGLGYGAALVRRIESEAAAIGVERLYLYTPDAEEFYARLGWTVDERCRYLGQRVAVMSKPIGAAHQGH